MLECRVTVMSYKSFQQKLKVYFTLLNNNSNIYEAIPLNAQQFLEVKIQILEIYFYSLII